MEKWGMLSCQVDRPLQTDLLALGVEKEVSEFLVKGGAVGGWWFHFFVIFIISFLFWGDDPI